MSLVQIAYQTILSKFREWGKLSQKDQLQIMQQASNLMGRSFRQALNMIEQNSKALQIYDMQSFYVMIVQGQRTILFKSNSRVRLNDCSCRHSWMRKVGQKAPYMCIHQILLELVLFIFQNKIVIEKGDSDGSGQLCQFLGFVS